MPKQILFFTNLHPLPWEPTRAVYNFEETKYLAKHAEITKLIPVPWFIWFKQMVLKGHKSPDGMLLFPFFYIPKLFTSLHPLFMLLSVIICVKPFWLFYKSQYVIASWAYAEGVAAALLKKLFKFRLVIECLGSDVNALMPKTLHNKQMKWAFSHSDYVTTKSKALAKTVVDFVPSITPEVVYNGVDFDVFKQRQIKPFSGSKSTFVFIGSLIPTKGVFELVEGFALVALDNPSSHLNIIGKGFSEQALKQKVVELNLTEKVTFIGAVPHTQLTEQIHKADALILPSYREGLPNVVMESLATGTPTVVTKVGGIPEVINQGENGIFIEKLDKKEVSKALQLVSTTTWNDADIKNSIAELTWENSALKLKGLLFAE